MNAVFQSFSIGANWWLNEWSNDNQTSGANSSGSINSSVTNANLTDDGYDQNTYLGVYGALGLGQGMFIIFYF